MKWLTLILLSLLLTLPSQAGESVAAAIAAVRAELAAERAAIAEEQAAISAERTAAREALTQLRQEADALEAQAAASAQAFDDLEEDISEFQASMERREREMKEAVAMLEARDHAALLTELGTQPVWPPGMIFPWERTMMTYDHLLAHASTIERGEFRIFDAAGEQRMATGVRVGWIAGAAQVDGAWQLLYTPSDGVQPRGYVSALAVDPAAGLLPVDLTNGLARQQPEAEGSWVDRLRAGGMVVWPLLAIALLALLMVVERTATYLRIRMRGARLEEDLPPLLRAGDFAAVTARLEATDGPMQRVWQRGLHLVRERHANLEEALQEAVLSEIPPLERFLSTLAVFAAVAPLLGLLGTVSGMIKTFDAISRFGGGDATVLSGGISEALVSTWFGLCVAIPILLAHAVLVRQARLLVGRLDQAALLILESAGRCASDVTSDDAGDEAEAPA